jgi:hypothetical protein
LGTGIAPGREPIGLPPDASHDKEFDFRAKAPARLVIEVDRQAWPKAAQISIFASQPTLDYRIQNLRAADSRVTFDDLPAGTFQINLQNAGHNMGGNRLAIDTLSHRQAILRPGETVTVRFANP